MTELEDALQEAEDNLLRFSHCLAPFGNRLRTKPLVGGYFGAAGFVLASFNTTLSGLDEPLYFVMHASSGLVLSGGDTKIAALAVARRLFRYVGTARLASLAARFAADCERIAAEQRRARTQTEEDTEDTEEVVSLRGRVRSIPKRRRQIFDAAGGKCHYCSDALVLDGKWHIEHKMPKALMGGNESTNLVASCVACNVKKRDRTDIEFMTDRSSA